MSKTIKNKSEINQVAVILFNLGGPDSLKAVKPFLYNLFNDKYIIRLPSIFRMVIAWLIATLRRKTAEKIYSYIGGKSSIYEETLLQKQELEHDLNSRGLEKKFKVFIAMRHWHPRASEVVSQLKDDPPNEIILLPLYPQFSTTTTKSSIEEFQNILKNQDLSGIATKTICCYPLAEGFIKTHVALIRKYIDKLVDKNNYRILFSAHGLPKKIIESGDPYQLQVEYTVNSIIKYLAIENLDYKITYQSRVGPVQWLEPNTEDEIVIAGKEQKNLVIVPIAFVSEHVETLVELDIEYKQIADKHAIEFIRVPTLSANKDFIEFLANLVIDFTNKTGNIIASAGFKQICNNKFSQCPCLQLKENKGV
ncbi:MAG: ferrochelatase [Rickettsiaceae bacterium]|nr:ferrochelatase [Rickettsiaceae bacterium]